MRITFIFLIAIFFLTGCEVTTQNTFLPSTRPDDIVIEYHDRLYGKDFHLSMDTSYAVFTLNGETKRIDFNMGPGELDKVFNALQVNNFSRIDTFKLPILNLPEESKKPVFSINVSWGKNSIEKYISPDTDIKEEWKEKYDNIVASIQVMSYDAIEKKRRDFILGLDESLYPEGSFLTLDMNTYCSDDSLFFYNSSDMGKENELKVRALDGKNIFTIFVNRKNPSPGQTFNIANSSFEIDVKDDINGLRFYLEGDSIKWMPVNEK